jgi:hypothetical protein
MNRRVFLKSTALALGSPGLLLLEGCPVNSNSVNALVTTVATAVITLLTYLGAAECELAQKVIKALAEFQAAMAEWASGSPTQKVIDAIKALAAVLAQFDPTAKFAELIGLALKALDVILGIVGGTVVRGGNSTALEALYHGQTPQNREEFVKDWNALAPDGAKIN